MNRGAESIEEYTQIPLSTRAFLLLHRNMQIDQLVSAYITIPDLYSQFRASQTHPRCAVSVSVQMVGISFHIWNNTSTDNSRHNIDDHCNELIYATFSSLLLWIYNGRDPDLSATGTDPIHHRFAVAYLVQLPNWQTSSGLYLLQGISSTKIHISPMPLSRRGTCLPSHGLHIHTPGQIPMRLESCQ